MRSTRATAAGASVRTPTRCTDPGYARCSRVRCAATGLFKHLFDFVGQYALVGTPVLLAATGGGERHALILEHQMRPLFGFFQALTLPVGVYASDTDFDGYELTSEAVKRRIDQAVTRSLPLVTQAAGQRVSEYVATW